MEEGAAGLAALSVSIPRDSQLRLIQTGIRAFNAPLSNAASPPPTVGITIVNAMTIGYI
jgi:hypothetical protein